MSGVTKGIILVESELVDQHSWLLVFTVGPLRPLHIRVAQSASFSLFSDIRKSLFSAFLCIDSYNRNLFIHTYILGKEEQKKYKS